MPTLNALRRFLRDSGCIEERSLSVGGIGTLFLEYVCKRKSGKTCRAIVAVDAQGGRIPDIVMVRFQRKLAPCLGRSWVQQIPEEDPFG